MADLLKLIESGASHEEIFSKIETNATNVNQCDSVNKSALHYAVETGDTAVISLLLSKKADVNHTDNNGHTPLDLAPNPLIARLLKSVGGVGKQDTQSNMNGAYLPPKDILSVHADLASEKLGSKALWANDEWFAEASNLLKVPRSIFHVGVFTERGQFMDGWESARHGALKRGGRDTAIIQLGAPGIVRGFDIDTNHFTGNFASEASIEGLFTSNPEITLDELKESKEWVEILPRSKLSSSAQHFFLATTIKKCSHIKFYIYPDGGVSRLRVYGDVTPDWNHINLQEPVDLASIKLGGKVVAVSDSFYSHQDNVLMPERGINMGDGWETRRSRRKGNREWIVIKLARAGTIERIEVDTNHFKGNYPDTVVMEGCFGEGRQWKEFLPLSKLQAHKQHYFSQEIKNVGPVTHVRVTIFPDGGISRLRLWGKVAQPSDLLKPELLHSNESVIPVRPLTEADFVTYGEVFDATEAPNVPMRSGQKYTWPAQLTARSDVPPQFYHMRAQPVNKESRMLIDALEKHQSSQTIIPSARDSKYLLVVALPSKLGGLPDLLNVAAFVVNGNQIINIKSGVWFHQILSMDKQSDFLVLSWENPATPHLEVQTTSIKSSNIFVALP